MTPGEEARIEMKPHRAPTPSTATLSRSRRAGRNPSHWIAATVFLGLALCACDIDSVAPVPDVAWGTVILPLPSEDPENPLEFTANVGMVASGDATTISIGLAGAEPGTVFDWRVRTGTCAGSGIPLETAAGAFPELIADGFGEDEALIVLQGRVSENGSYAAEVFGDASAGGELVGCSNMDKLS